MKTHAEHPKCSLCGKSLYKWMGHPPSKTWMANGKEYKGKNTTGVAEQPPRPEDPYAYCRNKKCDMYAKDQSKQLEQAKKTATKQVEKAIQEAVQPLELKPKPERCPNVANHAPGTKCVICDAVTPLPAPESDEPKAVREARERIRKAVLNGGQYSHNVIGLALTIVAQEMGGNKIANQLIDEYKLTEMFGIEKQS
jgi:hypothetical protein